MKIKTLLSEFNISYDTIFFNGIYLVPHNDRVLEPNITIFFDNGENILRFPLRLTDRTYLKSTNEDKLEFRNQYEIPYIFLEKWDNITMSLEMNYGSSEIIKLDSSSTDVLVNSSLYNLVFKDNEKLTLYKKSRVMYNIKNVLGIVFKIFLLGISIILIPIFLIESLLIALKFPGFSSHGNLEYLKDEKSIKRFFKHFLWRISMFSYLPFDDFIVLFSLAYKISNKFFFNKKQVMFISEYDSKLMWNLKFIKDQLEKDKNVEIFVLASKDRIADTGFKNIIKLFFEIGKSKVILTDSHFKLLHYIKPSKNQCLIQTWHGCGAFKKVGYSRFWERKPRQLIQTYDRKYDYIFSTTKNVNKFHSEAFGVYENNIAPVGLPRTDVFFDEKYAEEMRNNFYKKYPQLKDKKILLYAPTLRLSDYKDFDSMFNPNEIFEELNEEYAILIKLHIRTEGEFEINDEYSNYIIDIPKEDSINDLMFVTDVLITDYSSIVFEASLINIPMIFYTYDLEEYIAENGLYYEFYDFAPGKIVYTQKDIIKSIKNNDFEEYKIEPFKNYFFDDLDGKSTQRAIDLIQKSLKK